MAKSTFQVYKDMRKALKKRLGEDSILLFRIGDFYETFYENAEVVSQTIGTSLVTLKANDSSVPMTGFPCHQLLANVGILTCKGLTVGVLEFSDHANPKPEDILTVYTKKD